MNTGKKMDWVTQAEVLSALQGESEVNLKKYFSEDHKVMNAEAILLCSLYTSECMTRLDS